MIEFKKATANDIAVIRQLAKDSWNSAYKKLLSQEQIDYMLGVMYSHEVISIQMKNNNYNYYLILHDGDPAGFLGFEFHYEDKTTKLHRIYLLDQFKGKGLGKESMKFLKMKVQESSDERIILNVNKNNPAQKMYESQGFSIYAEGIFDIGNAYVMDDYLMEMKVSFDGGPLL